MKIRSAIFFFLFFSLISGSGFSENGKEHISLMHSISSEAIYGHVLELCREEYGGRLTGTPGFERSAEWLISKLKDWGLKPAGDNGQWRQAFSNPYTLVKPGSRAVLHIPIENGKFIYKNYVYQDDFMAGSTSGSGEVTAEVIYVGYGISAPELGYDDYSGVDVEGKIVLMEREVPVSPEKDPEAFRNWKKYSYHQYKVKNAADHGAAGMIYNYRIANPNCSYIKDLILTYVGGEIIPDLFAGSGQDHKTVADKIKNTGKPFSFSTGRIMTIGNVTEHHPEGVAANILGMIEGEKKNEMIVISAHLDHVGKNPYLIPGANDNASGVSVIMEVARALSKLERKPGKSILFAFFGAEEQGVKGSEFFLKNAGERTGKITACINLDGVGRGDKLFSLAGKNYPELFNYFESNNEKYIHRQLVPSYFRNNTRPRLDAAHFIARDIPSLSFSAYGMDLPYDVYHKTLDRPELLTPEIMEDLARLLFLAVFDMTYTN